MRVLVFCLTFWCWMTGPALASPEFWRHEWPDTDFETTSVETWVEIMNRVFHLLGDAIYAFGGEIDQYRGDGLVAFFGAKAAHEDDPERAVRAALEMQAAIQPYVDNAISKTINVPGDYPFEDFQDLYRQAFTRGLKGCTSFRPNPISGQILSSDQDDADRSAEPHCCNIEREGE